MAVRRRRALARGRRARRAHEAVQGAAGQALLRRPWLGAVRAHLRAARVLPNAHRAADPRRRRRRHRCATGAGEVVELGAGHPTRRACCSTRWTRPAPSTATSRWTSPPASSRMRPSSSSTSTPVSSSTASSVTSSAISSTSPSRTARRAWRHCSGARSATSRPGPGARLLAKIATLLGLDDRLLLGTDLVKDPAVIEAAYDDSAGVTAEFNRNLLHVVNRELGADFPARAFDRIAFFDAGTSRSRCGCGGRRRVVRIASSASR